MKRMQKIAMILITVVSIAGIIAGCNLTSDDIQTIYEVLTETDTDGSVVNAALSSTSTASWYESEDGEKTLVGATINMYSKNSDGTYSDTVTYTTTVDSLGNWDISGVDMGDYKVTGTATDWIFAPREVNISGEDMTIPPIIAYPNVAGAVDDSIVIILSWDGDTGYDLDSYLTYYNGTARDKVYYGDKIADVDGGIDNGAITLDRDITSSGLTSGLPAIETMVIDWSGTAPYYAASDVEDDGIDRNTLRYYVHCYSSAGSLSGVDGAGTDDHASSDAEVYVLFGGDHYGTWKMPFNTWERTLEVVDIIVDDSTDNFIIQSTNNIDGTTNIKQR